MNKSALTSKYRHTLQLKNYSQSTVSSYMNGLYKFIAYIQDNKIEEVEPTHISTTQIYTHVSSRTLKDVKSPIEDLEV